MVEALKEGVDLQAEFQAFDAAIRGQKPAAVSRWEDMIEAFHTNPKNPCPYVLKEENGTSALNDNLAP